MQSQYTGLLQFAQWNQRTQSVDLKAVSNQSAADFLSGEDIDANDNTPAYYRRVPWLFRSVEMRANAVGSAPFRIMRDDEEIDHSATWQDSQGLMPNPSELLWQIEAALTIWGMGYIWKERNRAKQFPLRYIVPSSIEPIIDAVAGLTGFERNLGSTKRTATTDDLIYFWKPDPYVELGPPQGSPVQAAMSAAGVLFNIDAFASAFFQRGAIKATLLTVEGNPDPDEKKKLKNWWARAVGGIQNAFNANVFSMAVKPVTVGEGLESLQNNNLTASKREDIATAVGIPQTLLFSTGAGGIGGGGVVGMDERHFYTKTIQPECDFIAGVLNSQLFRPLGYRLEFLLNTLDVFQEDEQARATAFKTYADAGLPKSLVAEMLGLELPDGWEYADLDPKPAAPSAPPPPAETPVSEPSAIETPGDDINAQVDAIVAGLTKDARQELYTWRRWATKRAGSGDDLLAFNVNGHLPAPVVAQVRDGLAVAATRDDVLAAFVPWLEDAPAAQGPQIATPATRAVQDGRSEAEGYTPSGAALKARLEPDRAAEDVLRRKIAGVLAEQRERIADMIEAGEEIDWTAIEAELRAVMTPELAKMATQQAMAFAAQVGIPIDIAKTNIAAWAWAQAYSYELIKGITATTQQLVGQVIAQFTGTPGMTIGDIVGALEATFGPVRAQMIAVTETTRAFTQANKITQDMLKEMGVQTLRVWQTSDDEKVCEICGPLDGKTEDEWDDMDGPPAHVQCRCWTTSKVVRNG